MWGCQSVDQPSTTQLAGWGHKKRGQPLDHPRSQSAHPDLAIIVVRTSASCGVGGWSTLGDVGYVDDEGYLYLTDRKSYMIISGGVNIYPQEAENILVLHSGVTDVAVFGIPNEEFGEEVKAVVQPADMQNATPEFEAELIEYCRSEISHIKCPKSIDFMEELPRHPTGKLYKRLLKDKYWQGHNSSIL